jgi:hypothetical protein
MRDGVEDARSKGGPELPDHEDKKDPKRASDKVDGRFEAAPAKIGR